MKKQLAGQIYPASITPFDSQNRIHASALRSLFDLNLRQSAPGFFIGGSSGECFLMSEDERLMLFEIAAEYKDRAILFAHVGAISTDQAIRYARRARDLRYDAIAATPPYYYGFDARAICQYYYDIAQAAGMPVLIYNFPGNTGKEFDLGNPHYQELFRSGAILGVKHTNQVVYQLERIKHLNPNLLVFDGYDETMSAGLILGADGAIGSTFNFMYPHYRKLYDAFLACDWEETKRLQIKANNIMEALVRVGLFPAIKYILTRMGIDAGLPRRPFLPLSDEDKLYVDHVLQENLENEPAQNISL